MPTCEQLLYGQDAPGAQERAVLAQSPGLGHSVASEIRQLCEGWGNVPVGGLARPALLSVPLKNTMSSLRGRLYAVVQVGRGHEPLHHALVLNEADYAAFGHNPFAVQRTFPFLEEWRDGLCLDRHDWEPPPDATLVAPPPSRSDQALLGECLRQLFLKSDLMLPLGQPEPGSDRTLALLVAALPNPLRRDLRFASFAGSERGSFRVAALSTPNCAFAGWQRLLLTEVAAIVPDDVERYVAAVGKHLAAGDLPGLCRMAREHATVPGSGAGPRRERAPAPVPEAPSAPAPRAAPPAPARFTPQRTPFGPDLAAPPRPPRRRPGSRSVRLALSNRTGERPFRPRGGRRRIAPLVVLGALLAATLWWRLADVERLLGDRLGWTRAGHETAAAHAPSLLSVVDVGQVYDRLVRRVARAGFGDTDAPDERDRREALLALQSQAAGPLLEQVDLFAQLADEGIQQAGRPERERERLRALVGQGERLEQEMGRLELAWHALATGADWRDLGRLPEREVAARRDSLERAARPSLLTAGRELGTTEARRTLASARRRVVGMSDLLTLMHAGTWTPEWEEQVEAAAELLSPRASAATRAYRNSAFSFLRLKRAERSPSARALPFAAEFRDGAWPAREVRDVLPQLRNEMGRFGRGRAPEMLAQTLELYAALERCATLAHAATGGDVLRELEDNAAVRFDPATYGDYIERIRFEAARALVEAGPDTAAAAPDLPRHLYSGDDSLAVHRFLAVLADSSGVETWRREQERQQRPFLQRWAQHRERAALREDLVLREECDRDLEAFVRLLAAVRDRAAAGEDWTAFWLDLRENVAALRTHYGARLATDRARAPWLALADATGRELDRARPLAPTAVTVRLPADVTEAPSHVRVRLTSSRGGSLVSAPVVLGPSAPAGTGWVGTSPLEGSLEVGPADALAASVEDGAGNVLFRAEYAPLQDRVGPGALARPRGDDAGTVSFQLDPSWWRGLTLPAAVDSP